MKASLTDLKVIVRSLRLLEMALRLRRVEAACLASERTAWNVSTAASSSSMRASEFSSLAMNSGASSIV